MKAFNVASINMVPSLIEHCPVASLGDELSLCIFVRSRQDVQARL